MFLVVIVSLHNQGPVCRSHYVYSALLLLNTWWRAVEDTALVKRVTGALISTGEGHRVVRSHTVFTSSSVVEPANISTTEREKRTYSQLKLHYFRYVLHLTIVINTPKTGLYDWTSISVSYCFSTAQDTPYTTICEGAFFERQKLPPHSVKTTLYRRSEALDI